MAAWVCAVAAKGGAAFAAMRAALTAQVNSLIGAHGCGKGSGKVGSDRLGARGLGRKRWTVMVRTAIERKLAP
jgi:hypothetical protein